MTGHSRAWRCKGCHRIDRPEHANGLCVVCAATPTECDARFDRDGLITRCELHAGHPGRHQGIRVAVGGVARGVHWEGEATCNECGHRFREPPCPGCGSDPRVSPDPEIDIEAPYSADILAKAAPHPIIDGRGAMEAALTRDTTAPSGPPNPIKAWHREGFEAGWRIRAEAQLEQLRSSTEKLARALEFYADEANWLVSPDAPPPLGGKAWVDRDEGEIARDCLKEIGEIAIWQPDSPSEVPPRDPNCPIHGSQREQPPGPSEPPRVPGHMGYPSQEEIDAAYTVLGVIELLEEMGTDVAEIRAVCEHRMAAIGLRPERDSAAGRPVVRKTLEPKEYSDSPMEGWKERGAEELPPYVFEAASLGRQRLAERAAQAATRPEQPPAQQPTDTTVSPKQSGQHEA